MSMLHAFVSPFLQREANSVTFCFPGEQSPSKTASTHNGKNLLLFKQTLSFKS